MHRKAAIVFEESGDYVEALKEYCVAEEYDELLRLAKDMGGRIEAWTYLNQVPIEVLINDADLSAQCLIFNLGNLNIDRGAKIFEAFQAKYSDTDIVSIMRFAEFYSTYQDGQLPRYQSMTEEQVQLLSLGPVAKAMLLIENAVALLEQMRYEEAEASIRQVLLNYSKSNAFVEYFANNQLAQIYEEVGRLNDSLFCYERANDIILPPQVKYGMETNYYVGLAGVHMRRMELERAEEILSKVVALVQERQIHNQILNITIDFHLSEIQLLRGNVSEVIKFIDDVSFQYPKFNILAMSRLIYELDCLDSKSDHYYKQFLMELDKEENYRKQLFMHLVRARLLKRCGDIDQAMIETDEILHLSRLSKNRLRMVEAGLVKVYLLQDNNKYSEHQRDIRNLLLETLHYAYRDHILMPFYLERRTVLPLLQELVKSAETRKALNEAEYFFLQQCIAICEGQDTAEFKQELLSSRELEILQELALGITNREIAEKLCISQATVKTHVLSIFNKLGVSSRMMAVDTGRREGLIT